MHFDVQSIVWRLSRRPSRAEGRRRPTSVVPRLEVLEERVVLDDTSAGVRGINARAIRTPDQVVLTGEDVRIGQMEGGRPGKPGFDNTDKSNSEVRPAAVYLGVNNAVADQNVNNHAETVAGVMIANGARDSGVSPKASLYASAEPGGSVVTAL